MYLRLYFLLPDEDQARKVVNHLLDEGLHARNIHAHQHSVDMSKTDLPAARMWKKLDLAQQVRRGRALGRGVVLGVHRRRPDVFELRERPGVVLLDVVDRALRA